MNKKIKISISLVIVLVLIAVLYVYSSKENKNDLMRLDDPPISTEELSAAEKLINEGGNLTDLVEGLVYYPPGIGMYEGYTKDSSTYESEFGYSFLYPSHLSVRKDPEALIPERLFILPTLIEDFNGSAIIISVAKNNENVTPLEWLDSPASGAELPQNRYLYKWDIDGQEAIAIEMGGWVVVNTSDGKYRLSIALRSGDSDTLFTEMGIIIDSLKFSK